VVVLGGAKVAEKLPVAAALLDSADTVLVGGAMATTFLAAQGLPIGTSLQDGDVATAREFAARAAASGVELMLPVDLAVAPDRSADSSLRIVAADGIPSDQMALDIGPETARQFEARLAGAGTIFWNGPMGVCEIPRFAAGTLAVARAIAGCNGFTVVGGGDTAAAVRSLGFTDAHFSHVSTGGGASLEFLQGRELPGLAALQADDPVPTPV